MDFFLILFFPFFHISHKLGTHHVSKWDSVGWQAPLHTHLKALPWATLQRKKKKAFVFPCEMSSGSMWSKACTTPIWQKAEMTKPALTLIWDVCSLFWASIDRYVSILTDIYTKMDTDASLYTSNGYSTVIDAASEWNICQMKYLNDGFTRVALT